VYGQKFSAPRIVYQLDTGIFLNKKQEEKVIETFYWKNIYKENLDSMFLQAYDCQMYLKKISLNYSALSDSYVRLDEKHKELRRDCTLELREKDTQLDQAKIKLDREIDRKKKWRRVALVEGGIITAIILILVL
jgi:hypothetical protein